MRAFLDAYLQVEGGHVGTLSTKQQDDLLDLLTLEKAAYEICYEAANRPAWLAVPLRGMATIVERLIGSGGRAKKPHKGNTDE
jgi:maltose alpha-D-glucosyltransferase/alpha-amylase